MEILATVKEDEDSITGDQTSNEKAPKPSTGIWRSVAWLAVVVASWGLFWFLEALNKSGIYVQYTSFINTATISAALICLFGGAFIASFRGFTRSGVNRLQRRWLRRLIKIVVGIF